MFKLLKRIIILFLSNLIALLAADYFINGFEIMKNPEQIIATTAIFTALNIFIKPLLKIILSPIIIITLGLGILLVNAVILQTLDFLSDSVMITGIGSLFYATLIISGVNIIITVLTKKS
ncbi:MAG: phage holin family protein [Patescibacteria group bacterium]